jgi:zinc protease
MIAPLSIAVPLALLGAPAPAPAAKSKGTSTSKGTSKGLPEIVTGELDDGTDLVVAMMPSERLSVRLVIRSGGDEDPPGKAGLAHLLEHLIFHGTYDDGEGAMFERVWAAGGNLNAYTSSNWTTYVLDTHSYAFESLAPSFLTMVTSPALPFSSFDRERGVVGAEAYGRPSEASIMFAFDQQAFPSANGGLTVIGTEKSRAAIAIEDIEQWYATHYVPENAVLVVAGDVTVEQVKRVASQGLRWPPKLAPPQRDVVETPNAPSEAKAQSWLTVTVHGRLVDGSAAGACEAAAGLLELRARKRVVGDEAMVADVGTFCHRQRGHDFLLLYVVTSSPESSQIPDWLKDIVKGAVKVPASAAEKALVEARRRTFAARARSRPDVVADQIMIELHVDDRTPQQAVEAAMSPPALRWADVPKLLAGAAQDSALIELHFSRFEG